MTRPNTTAVNALRDALVQLQGGAGPLCVGCGRKPAVCFGEASQRNEVFFGCCCDDCCDHEHHLSPGSWCEPLYPDALEETGS